ncbi:hypothetical protein ACQWHL_27745, partial [Salmonella enterica subsp. enterica serovar Infantis]
MSPGLGDCGAQQGGALPWVAVDRRPLLRWPAVGFGRRVAGGGGGATVAVRYGPVFVCLCLVLFPALCFPAPP